MLKPNEIGVGDDNWKKLSMLEKWCYAIAHHEGYYPGSASYRNNNPGNFRCSGLVMGELGATKCANNLAVFPDFETGLEALKQFLVYACTDKLRSYKSGMSLLEFYEHYAPSADNNNPNGYASAVAKDLGVSVSTKIADLYQQEPKTDKPEVEPVEPQDVVPDAIDPALFWQQNPRYKGVKLGNSNLPFQTNACFLCCLSYMVQEDPLVVMKRLMDGGGMNGALIVSDKAAEILGLELLEGNSNIPGKMTDIDYMPTFSPTIKEVSLNGWQHFVVRLIDKDNSHSGSFGTYIFDPWTGKEQPIAKYPFRSYRLFRRHA